MLPALTRTNVVGRRLLVAEAVDAPDRLRQSTLCAIPWQLDKPRLIASLPSTSHLPVEIRRSIDVEPSAVKADSTGDHTPAMLAKAVHRHPAHVRARKSVARSRKLPYSLSSRRITVQTGMFATILTRGIKSMAVADPAIADLVVLSTSTALVNGKGRGTTNIVLRDATGIRTYEVRVIDRLKVTPQEVEAAIGLPKVKVRLVGDAIVIDGDVENQEQSARVKALAGVYADKIIDLTTVKPATSAERPAVSQQVQEAIGIPSVQARVVGESVILKGTVQNDEQKQQAERIASLYGPQVMNFLEVEKKPVAPPPTVDEMKSMIGLPTVQVREVRDRLVLEGEVPTSADKDRAEAIAKQSGKVVDSRLRTQDEKAAVAVDRAKQIQDAIAIAGVTVQAAEDKVILKGSVTSQSVADRAVQLAKAFSNEVISLLEVQATPKQHQVRVDMKIVEISLDSAKDLGFDVNPATQGYLDFTGTLTFGAGNAGSTSIGSLGAKLLALQHKNQAKILSSPSATVLSGKKVEFTVGGEIPIPESSFGSSGTQGGVLTQTVTFRPFGIIMKVEPKVEGEKDVTMKLTTEVSQPDFGNAVVINGSRIPGFRTRKSDTEVLVKDGQTLVIGGLIDHQITKNVSSMPILGDIPILGELLKSTRFQRSETELVIFVTPHVSVVSGG